MISAIFSCGLRQSQSSRRTLVFLVTAFLILQPALLLVSTAQGSQRAVKKSVAMTEDQRIAHVLSRLTFGARPGDFEKVQAMSLDAFISQQLDPDSIDNSAVLAKLRRLPTLGMATPVIIEQYTPPKPAVAPSPNPTKSPDNAV